VSGLSNLHTQAFTDAVHGCFVAQDGTRHACVLVLDATPLSDRTNSTLQGKLCRNANEALHAKLDRSLS
jgi:hypothetical protein